MDFLRLGKEINHGGHEGEGLSTQNAEGEGGLREIQSDIVTHSQDLGRLDYRRCSHLNSVLVLI